MKYIVILLASFLIQSCGVKGDPLPPLLDKKIDTIDKKKEENN
jgi:hypothetical protein